jgi:hypothetical protein
MTTFGEMLDSQQNSPNAAVILGFDELETYIQSVFVHPNDFERWRRPQPTSKSMDDSRRAGFDELERELFANCSSASACE